NTREISDGMLAIRVAEAGAECTIVLRGELDLANTATAEAQVTEAMANGSSVVIDMRQLEFIDSTGIALLVRAIQSDESAGRLRFVPSESDAVKKVLGLTGVGERMALADGSAPA
ncbi:MAG TPA: STAS domain-containing protein, partial [Nitrospiraceae bacterium]|nr:STAS domain-containing protein [Nitrospiraceae bacterium]